MDLEPTEEKKHRYFDPDMLQIVMISEIYMYKTFNFHQTSEQRGLTHPQNQNSKAKTKITTKIRSRKRT